MCGKHITTVLIISGFISCFGQQSGPIVNIQGLGGVLGSIGYTAWTNRTIYEFHGIPYGQAPVGALRFKPTVKVSAWGGTRDATQPGTRCPQIDVNYVNVENEDCLTLSVYSNSLDADRPVMVYIHGGWFYLGGADQYKPNFLLESNIVLVVIQYRLGPLGFLSTMSDDIPGNVGMLDVITALEWVQQYIGYFGGNSSHVTIFGESAGAAAVSSLQHSPLVQSRSTPLFQRAIMQSGSVFAPWAVSDTPLEGTNDIAARLGCTGAAVEQCLRGVSIQNLLEAFSAHRSQTIANSGYPYVAGTGIVVGGPSSFLPQHPKNYLGNSQKNIAVMAGTNAQDGLFLLNELHKLQPQLLQTLNTSHALLHYVHILHEKFGHSKFDGSLEAYAFQHNFLMSEMDRLRWEDLASSLTDICGTHGIKGPVLADVQSFSNANPGNVYLYSFDYSSALTQKNLTVPYPHARPVHHAEELKYLFPIENLDEADVRMAKTMVQLWASFAISGVPVADSVGHWPPMDRIFGPYLKINTESKQQNFYLNEFSATADKNRGFGGTGSSVTASTLNTSHALLHYVRTLHEKFGHSKFDGSLESYAIGHNFLVRETERLYWENMASAFTDICGIHGIKAPVMNEIHAFSRVNPGNVYLYSFDYASAVTRMPEAVPFPHERPVDHGEDLKYLFPRENLDEADIVMAKVMVQLWTSFATRGVPAAKQVGYWPPTDRLFGPYLKINTESEQRNYYLNEFFATSDRYRVYGAGSRVAASVGSIVTILIVSLAVSLFV